MKRFRVLITILILLSAYSASAQDVAMQQMVPAYSVLARMRDSISSARVPALPFPEAFRNRMLPPEIDNSQNQFWPGIREQFTFYSCQQHCGVGYVFGYEINRLRNQPGWLWENSYAPHYTWNFMNEGERYTGVNFMQSFEVLKQQGQMNSNVYGDDTSQSYHGWISGYDKYLQGMTNRLKSVYAIEVNTLSGINQLRNYLYDHLDGSSSGGIACFTTSSGTLYNMELLPAGTAEEGKNVILSWQPSPVHGMAVVGYNDSIRFDVNNDGNFTNNLDINGDGSVDVRDWEIGGFKVANSYGVWWSNEGYVYGLYSSFAKDYPYGGLWNNRVYVVDADTGYTPKLTVKVNLTYNSRKRIRVLAGINADTSGQMPVHTIDFPIFNFQGGDYPMQGNDTSASARDIEFGLDVTPLLNFVENEQPARYFFMVEEQDPEHLGQGTLKNVTFINYQNGVHAFQSDDANVAITDNGLTMVSVIAAGFRPVVQITTADLPPANPLQPFQFQLEATGGKQPYTWSLVENYFMQPSNLAMPPIVGPSLFSHQDYKTFRAVALPFQFSFYGKTYDTIYINHFGFISFEPQFLPEPYITDEMNMLETFALIAPAFSQKYAYMTSLNDGIWYHADASQATIRWRVSVAPFYTTSVNDFALVLYPDGRFAFRYGTINNRNFTHKIFYGVSKGDDSMHNLGIQWDANDLSGKSLVWHPTPMPSGISLSESGLLTLTPADSSMIYDLNVRATDAGRIYDTKVLSLSDGLVIEAQAEGEGGGFLKPGKPVSIKLLLKNTGDQPIVNLQLTLTHTDSLVTVTDSLHLISLLNTGQTVTLPAAFSLLPSNTLMNDYPWMAKIRANTSDRLWKKDICFRVAAPVIAIEKSWISDGDDNLLNPGEVADLVVPIRNSGWLAAHNLEMMLVSKDSSITILSDTVIPIDLLNPSSEMEFRFQLKASRSNPVGEMDTVLLKLSDPSGELQSQQLFIPLGKKPVAILNLAVSKTSQVSMMEALDSLKVAYDTLFALGFDYNRYSSIFLILGNSVNGSHTLTVDEATSLTSYLMNNGNLYMEGYSTWYYLNKTPLHPYFKYSSEKVAPYFYPVLTGVGQTFANSMNFQYISPIDYAVFSFEPKPPAYATFTNMDITPGNLEIVYDGADYKTIGTFLEFSSLVGSNEPSTRKTLMKRYLDFFQVSTAGPFAYFHASNAIACTKKAVSFIDDSFDNITSRSWEFPGGTPASSVAINPEVVYQNPGEYDVKLTVSDGLHVKTILRKSYITVEQCTGIEQSASQPDVRIFPNPASGYVNVALPGDFHGDVTITLFDFSGRIVKVMQSDASVQNQVFTIGLSDLRRGLYHISVKTSKGLTIRKLMLN